MIDNLQNAWGRFIIDEKLTQTNVSFHDRTPKDIQNLKDLLDKHCHPFKFVNTFASGSKANQWILSNIGELNINKVLIGSGSYISGDSFSIYSTLSTSFINGDGTGEFMTNNANDLAKKHIIPLPYHIPCDQCKEKIHDLEKSCVEEIHRRCVQAKVEGHRITGLFLELVLQCNGAILSNSFLEDLATLSEQHDFKIALDEVLTGGRCKKILKVLDTPAKFQDCISYISMGKWMGMGVVLCHEKVFSKYFGQSVTGETTGTNYNEAIKSFNAVLPLLDNINKQREKVLGILKVDEKDAWGDGILIWCNCVVTKPVQTQALNGRYLPFINNEKNDVYDPTQFSTSTRFKAKLQSGESFMFNKISSCDKCFKAVEFWLRHSKHENGDRYVRTVTDFLVDKKTDKEFQGKKMIYSAFESFAKQLQLNPKRFHVEKEKYKFAINMVFQENILEEKQIGPPKKRERVYVLDDDAKISKNIKLND